jgi:hypothetical protein
MLEEYVFVDEDYNVVAKMGLHDDEVAEERVLALSMQHGKSITCLKVVTTVNAILSA